MKERMIDYTARMDRNAIIEECARVVEGLDGAETACRRHPGLEGEAMSDWKKELKDIVVSKGSDAEDLGEIGLIGVLFLFAPLIIAGCLIALFR